MISVISAVPLYFLIPFRTSRVKINPFNGTDTAVSRLCDRLTCRPSRWPRVRKVSAARPTGCKCKWRVEISRRPPPSPRGHRAVYVRLAIRILTFSTRVTGVRKRSFSPVLNVYETQPGRYVRNENYGSNRIITVFKNGGEMTVPANSPWDNCVRTRRIIDKTKKMKKKEKTIAKRFCEKNFIVTLDIYEIRIKRTEFNFTNDPDVVESVRWSFLRSKKSKKKY